MIVSQHDRIVQHEADERQAVPATAAIAAGADDDDGVKENGQFSSYLMHHMHNAGEEGEHVQYHTCNIQPIHFIIM